jgi:hypothetical protein
MPFRPERPKSIAATWSRRLGRFALTLALMALLLHRVDMLEMPNAVAAVLLATLISVFVLGLSIIGFFMLWHIGAKGGHASFSGLVMALIILIPVGLAASRFVLLPRIHDISTDMGNQPEWLEQPEITASWLPRSEVANGTVLWPGTQTHTQITGRRYDGAIDRVLLAVQAVAEEKKWTQVANIGVETLVDGLEPNPAGLDNSENGSNGEADPTRAPLPAPRPNIENEVLAPLPTSAVIQYRTRSLVLGIRQDVVVRLSEEEETTFVDMRAATRVGDHDFGLNADLIRTFLRDLDLRLLGIAGG